MTQEEINYIITEIQPHFTKWKHSGFMRLAPDESVKIRDIYFREMGRPMPTCSNCFVESLYSLIVRAEAQQELQAATIADDEQKPKRKRRTS
jgi:hypothetical protein